MKSRTFTNGTAWCSALAVALMIGAPSSSEADVADAYGIDRCAPNYALNPGAYEWDQYEYILRDRTTSYGENDSCIASVLQPGETLFSFAGIPLSAVEMPGRRHIDVVENDANCFESRFARAWMRAGQTELSFTRNFGSNNWCAVVDDVVVLSGPDIDPREVFRVSNDGEGYVGATSLSFSLMDLSPELAMDLAALAQAIREERANLVANAGKVTDWDAQRAQSLDKYKKLEAELKALAARPFDDITVAALKQILNRYPDVSPDVRNALLKFLADVHKNAEDLKRDVARHVAAVTEQARQLEALATQQAIAAGWNPDAMDNYLSGGFTLVLPPVAVPDLGANSYFDGSDDPYDPYATSLIEAMTATLEGDHVADKPAFAALVRSWRRWQEDMEETISKRGTVNALEMGDFLRAQNKVLAFVRNYMGEDGWFNDSTASPAVRRYVDGAIKRYYPRIAAQIKEGMNQWQLWGTREQMLEEMTLGMGAVVSEGYGEQPAEVKGVVERVLGWVGGVAMVGVTLTPIGDVLDACEAITGRELCKTTGKELQTWERVAAGLGVVIGSGQFWHAVGGAVPGVKTAATRIAGIITPVTPSKKPVRLVIDAIDASDLELRAAVKVARLGRGPVVLRAPIPGRRTSDLLIDGAPYDIYSPTTANANAIISAIAKKNSQASGIVLDLSQSAVDPAALGNILARVRGAGATNIQDIIVL